MLELNQESKHIFRITKPTDSKHRLGLFPNRHTFHIETWLKQCGYKYDIQKQSCSTDYGILNYGVRIRFYSSNAASLFKLRWT